MKFKFDTAEFLDAAVKLGMTYESLAERCGVSQSTIGNASKGQYLTITTYSRISKVLGIKYAEVINFRKEKAAEA